MSCLGQTLCQGVDGPVAQDDVSSVDDLMANKTVNWDFLASLVGRW